MSHEIFVWNFRKTRRAIRETNGVTVRKEVRKTNVTFRRNEYSDMTGEKYINSISTQLEKN